MGDTDYALFVGGNNGGKTAADNTFRIDCFKFDGINIARTASTTIPSRLVEFAICTVNVNGKQYALYGGGNNNFSGIVFSAKVAVIDY